MQFWLFRVSVLAAENMSLFAHSLNDASRYELLRRAIQNPQSALYRGTVYSLYNVSAVADSLVGRISHPDEIDRTIPAPSPNTLMDIREESNAWAHFIFTGFGEQIFAVQRKQDFFAGEADGLAQVVARILQASIADDRVQVSVSPLKRDGDFWSVLARATHLYKVSFEFIAPNMFGGRKPLAELVNLQNEMHNATIFRTGLENPNGHLQFPRNEQTVDEVDYAAAGGGSWEIDARDEQGNKFDVKSDRDSAIIIEVDDDSETKKTIAHRIVGLIQRIRDAL